jgi:CheY-like chemotaxis protein
MSEAFVEFRISSRVRALAAANALAMIPALSERSLRTAELRYGSRGVITANLFFDNDRFTQRVRQRVTFWCARAGGALRTGRRSGSPLATDVVRAEVLPADLSSAVAEICAAAGHAIPAPVPLAPLLVVDTAGPAMAGVVYDAAMRRLFLPAPVAPPVGDILLLEVLARPSRRRIRAFVRIVDARTREAAAPGSPAGFTLALDRDAEALHALLSTALPSEGLRCTRAAPRVRAAAAVHFRHHPDSEGSGRAASGALRDISDRGAFIRTADPAPVGSRVRVALRFPDGSDFEAVATVVRVVPDGMGVEFRLDTYGQAQLATVLAAMAGRSHRVLIVDDDALARRMLEDAFTGRGFDVLTAPNAELGLHILADEILTLEALVTDAYMPALDGEAFVRRIRGVGGEHDLPIIVATASSDPALDERLRTAGANRVVGKSGGAELVVDATLDELRSRGTYDRRVTAGSPPAPGGGDSSSVRAELPPT